MAIRTPTIEYLSSDRTVIKITWSGLLNGDTGSAIEFSQYADRSVQVSGTFGSGGSTQIEGSNNGASYNILQDTTNTSLVFTEPGIETIIDMAAKTRPKVTAGDGTTNLSVTILARK